MINLEPLASLRSGRAYVRDPGGEVSLYTLATARALVVRCPRLRIAPVPSYALWAEVEIHRRRGVPLSAIARGLGVSRQYLSSLAQVAREGVVSDIDAWKRGEIGYRKVRLLESEER